MEGYILLLGFILGFAIAALRDFSSKREKAAKTLTTERKPAVPSTITYYPPRYQGIERVRRRLWELSRARHLSRQGLITAEKGKSLVQNWRKSIVGLTKLADENLTVAKEHLETSDYESAVQSAFTSVENIARALIHCFGGKPDPSSGQEEALRMLSRRFVGDEKIEFENAIDIVAKICHNRIVLGCLSTHNMRISLFDRSQTKRILESASKIVGLFKQILTHYFSTEIPELNEACP